MIFFRRRHRKLDERVHAARAERELSEARLKTVKAQSARIAAAGLRNQFADAIRRRIIEGHGGP